MSRAPTDAGFSLIEALVALGVFAVAGVGLVQLQAHSLQTLSRVESSALGALLASNTLTEIVASRVRPDIGARTDIVEFAGRTWRVEVVVAGASDPRTRRVSVAAREREDGPPSSVSAFIPAPQGGAP